MILIPFINFFATFCAILDYYPNCEVQYKCLPNIHAVRKSFLQLRAMLMSDDQVKYVISLSLSSLSLSLCFHLNTSKIPFFSLVFCPPLRAPSGCTISASCSLLPMKWWVWSMTMPNPFSYTVPTAGIVPRRWWH